MTDVQLPPAGWYADPEDSALERLWDGARWTDQWRPQPVAWQVRSKRQVESVWRRVRYVVLAAIVAHMVFALVVDRWPPAFFDEPLMVLYIPVFVLAAAEMLFGRVLLGALLIAAAARNGGLLPALGAAALLGGIIGLDAIRERLHRPVWVAAEVVALGGLLVLGYRYHVFV